MKREEGTGEKMKVAGGYRGMGEECRGEGEGEGEGRRIEIKRLVEDGWREREKERKREGEK